MHKATHIQSKKNTFSGILFFARSVVYLVAFAALAVCAILLPELAREEAMSKPTDPMLIVAFLGTAYILATPFFVALYQSHKLLRYIGDNKFFTLSSLRSLQTIQRCSVAFCILVVLLGVSWVSWLRIMNPQEDAPPFMMLIFILSLTSGTIAVFVAVLKKLLAEAVKMKSENDLIV